MTTTDQKPAEQYLVPATTGEIIRDSLRVWGLLIVPTLLIFGSGAVVRPMVGTPFGFLLVVAAMALAALILWYPVLFAWRTWLTPRLETTGPIRASTLILSSAALLMLMALIGSKYGVGSIDFMFMIIGPMGFAIMTNGLALRTGDSLHCPSCDYQAPPGDPTLLDRCSECGHELKDNLVRGRRTRSPFMIRTGAIIVALWLVPIFGSLAGLSPVVYRYVPTPVLIGWTSMSSATQSPRLQRRVSELTTRTLTHAQRTQLINLMLDMRRRDGNTPFAAAAWIDGLVQLPDASPDALSHELKHRHFTEGFEPVLRAPAAARVGDTVTLQVKGTHRMAFHIHWPWLRIESITVNGERLPDEDDPRWAFGLYLDPRGGPFQDPHARLSLDYEWTPSVAGPHTIRVTVHRIYTPSGIVPPLDGSLETIADQILWTGTVTLERTINVSR